MFTTEIALVVGALLVLFVDLAFLRHKSHKWRVGVAGNLAILTVVVAGWRSVSINIFVLSRSYEEIVADFLAKSFLAADNLALPAKLIVLFLGFLTLLLIRGTSRLKNPAEHVALTLFALAGLTLMCAAQNLLVIFLALELASLSLYILAGFDKTRPESAEAGLKYFLYGGTAAAFLLFGFSLLYGLTGEIHLTPIAAKLATLPTTPLLVVAFVMVLVGFGYKAAAAPFHLWAPDAYQGAPVPSAALIASASKVGGLVLLVRFLIASSASAKATEWTPHGGWFAVLAVLILASLLVGNIGALVQSNVRRLLAYSAIAHAGVLLLAALADSRTFVTTRSVIAPELEAHGGHLLYYLLTYGLATVGAFGVVAVLENNGGCQKISDLAGLWRRSRLLTVTLFVFILSLAGVPPLAGFFAKFNVFLDALHLAQAVPGAIGTTVFWLVLLGVAMSAVALYYYLQILKAAFIAPPADEQTPAPVSVPWPTALALVLAAVALVALSVIL